MKATTNHFFFKDNLLKNEIILGPTMEVKKAAAQTQTRAHIYAHTRSHTRADTRTRAHTWG